MRVRSIVNTTWPVFWEPGGLPLLEIAKVQLFSDRVAFCQKTCEVSNKLFTSYWTWGMRFHGKRCKLRCNMVQVPKRLQQVWMAGSRISQSRPQNCVRMYSVHIFMCVYIYNYVYVYIYIYIHVFHCVVAFVPAAVWHVFQCALNFSPAVLESVHNQSLSHDCKNAGLLIF